MWKWLILILVGYALYRMFMNDRKKSGEDTKKEKEHLIATGEMVKDRFAEPILTPTATSPFGTARRFTVFAATTAAMSS